MSDYRRDYGPTGCCAPGAFGVICSLAVIGWGFVFLGIQLVRWVI